VVKISRNGVLQPASGVPPCKIAVPSPKVVTPPPGNAVLLPTVATRGHVLRLKCTKCYFGTPEPLARFKGPTSKGREGERKIREGRGGNVDFYHLLLSNLTTAFT